MRKSSAPLPNQKNRQGVVIISLALVLAALGIAVGVSSLSNLTNSQRESTGGAQGSMALNCSESAIEIGLACIADKIANGQQSTITSGCAVASPTKLDNDDPASCSYSSAATEVRSSFTIPQIAKNDTEIIRLDTTGNPRFALTWETNFSQGNVIEVNLLTPDGSGGFNSVQRFYSCNYSDPAGIGFTSANYIANNRCELVGTNRIQTNGASFAQITPRGNSADNVIVDIAGNNTPLQGYRIASVGTAGEALRNTDVLYLLPSNARVFNNTLYADSVTVN